MHLRLSEDEFATLIDMVSLAGEIASLNQKPDSQQSLASFVELEDKLLERAKHHGHGDILEVDPDSGKHRVTAQYQAQSCIQDCIDEMRNEVFWDELSYRLAERDLLKRFGKRRYLQLSDVERATAINPLQKAYWEGFSHNGLDQVHQIAPHDQG